MLTQRRVRSGMARAFVSTGSPGKCSISQTVPCFFFFAPRIWNSIFTVQDAAPGDPLSSRGPVDAGGGSKGGEHTSLC